ncbi:MAG: phosphodiester glycosidase family protein [Candidatus Sericytochromatia bacterium]
MQKKTVVLCVNLFGDRFFSLLLGMIFGFSLGSCFPEAVFAKPVQVYSKSLQGASLRVVQIDLTDPATHLDMVLANKAPQANNSEKSYGDESFGAMVRRSKAAAMINGTFFSKDAQKRVMGNMVSGGRFLKYSPWENFGTTLGITASGRPEMKTLRAGEEIHWKNYWFSVTCGPRLLKQGAVWINPDLEGFKDPHVLGAANRSALGFSQDGKTLYLVIFYGGVTLQKEAQVMKALGAYEAMNLDGGASQGLAQGGSILLAPGRYLTNAIAVYDSRFPATAALQASRRDFQSTPLDAQNLLAFRPVPTPTARPTPTLRPSPTPTLRPSSGPTARPTVKPTPRPTTRPTALPTARPTLRPSPSATARPTPQPIATSTLVNHKITPLTAPKYFFWYVYRKDYPKAWELLSEKSKAVIVHEIASAVDDPEHFSEQRIRRAMDSYETPFAETFWGAFRQNLEIDTWVKQNFTLLDSGTAQALVRVEPIGIDLQILFEDGLWRLGYAETFFQGN